MGWKDVANAGLYRATGYKLVDPRHLKPPPKPQPSERLAKHMPGYYEPEVKTIVRTVRQRTMTAHEKLNALVVATRYVIDHGIPGDFVECGVWRGGSMQAVALALLDRGVTDRELHLFDTFEGMSEPTEEDRAMDGTPAAQLLATSPRDARVWAVASLDDVRQGMEETGYPAERIHYCAGKVEDTIPEHAPERIALLRLDTDWYESTRHELVHLYARVPPGGVLIFDDYSAWQGARKAVDEFIAATGEPLLLVPIAAGRIAVKPAPGTVGTRAASRAAASVAPMTGAEATARRPPARVRRAARARALPGLLARHRALAALLAAGFALRAVALVAIYPGIFFSDSNAYVDTAATGTLSVVRVSAYSFFVWPFYVARSAGALIIVQHLLALAMAVLLYALLVRRGVPRWLAALGVAPALLDAYLISVEHAIMSDTVFHACVVAAVALLLWGERPRWGVLAAAGLLLGCAGVVRSVGAPFFAVFVVYLLVRRLGWRSLVAFATPWVLVTAGYAALFDVQHGEFAMNEWGSRYLYARVAPFADCARLRGLPADERSLCPPAQAPGTTQAYLWGHTSPIRDLPHSADPRIRDFALRVIRDKPLTYARVILGDVTHYFEPGHRIGRNDYSPAPWEFPADPARAAYPGYRGPIRPAEPRRGKLITPDRYVGAMTSAPHTNATASRLLRRYQRFAYTSGQVLALCLLVVLAGLLRRRGAWRLRLDATLLAAATLTALIVAGALSLFSYRYGLTAVILLPVAGALAGASLLTARA